MSNPNLPQRTQLFLTQIGVNRDQALLQNTIVSFFIEPHNNPYVLFKNGSLYFIEENQTLNTLTVSSMFDGNYYLRFDGTRIARIEPNYYLGAASDYLAPALLLGAAQTSWGSEFSSNNNNNNNNNNNGNNNG